MHWRTIVASLALCGALLYAADEKPSVITFKKADLGKVPAGWTAAKTGGGEGSVWKVLADDTAPSKSGYVLAQTAESPNNVFNVCVKNDGKYQDVELSVDFTARAGTRDQGGGFVWRYQDNNNYYICRMNPLEDNFRVYKLVNGKRSPEFQNAEAKVPLNEWHSLKVKMVGTHIECFLDGKKYLDVRDASIPQAGQVGLWTKADAQTLFDNFRIGSPRR